MFSDYGYTCGRKYGTMGVYGFNWLEFCIDAAAVSVRLLDTASALKNMVQHNSFDSNLEQTFLEIIRSR